MKKYYVLLLVVGCAALGGIAIGSYAAVGAQGPPPTPAPGDFPGEPLPVQKNDYFAGSGACAACHGNLTDEAGTDVSIDAYWRSTMMANASRDPYWQASVRVEVLDSPPELSGVIEDKCATCHTPMARFTVAQGDQQGLLLDDGFLGQNSDLHMLAMDGVSCTLCHQIEADTLSEPASFSGGFVIDPDLPMGERVTYSRFEVRNGLSQMMAGASGFVPVQGMHITESELCASCHTLYTPYLDADGNIAGEFPEQMPYFEWLHSDYAESQSCQSCHMPIAEGAVVTSSVGNAPPRSPFARHNFTGGNVYMQNMFRVYGADLNVTASSQHFSATYDRTLDRLQTLTATVALENATLADGVLTADVVISPQTGHKFPTGFPSRRAWLHVTVTDAAGEVIFESGEYQPNGKVLDDIHDADSTQYEPHYQTIDSPDQVQIYESVMTDTDGNVTNKLLRGSGYIKDNRLLPSGFDKQTAESDFATYGEAFSDADFVGGSDTVRYQVDVSAAEGPFTVEVDVLYLSIGFNWAQKLEGYNTLESGRFLAYYAMLPNIPTVVASTSVTVE
jgi:hypothetical protein